MPFMGGGGPDAFLTAETTESTQEDDASISFRGSGGFPGFPTSRDSRGFGNRVPSSKGGSRGRSVGQGSGGQTLEGSSSAFNFPGASGINRYGNAASFPETQSSRGSYKTGTSSFNAPPSYAGVVSSSNNDPFPVPSGFGSPSGGFPSPVGGGPAFSGAYSPPSKSRLPHSGSSSSASSGDAFPQPSGLSFPQPSGLSFPQPAGLSGGNVGPLNPFPSPGGSSPGNRGFPGSGSSVPFPGATYSAGNFPPPSGSGPISVEKSVPIDANILNALKGNPDVMSLGINLDELMGMVQTTTK